MMEKKLGPVVFTWSPSAQEVCSSCTSLSPSSIFSHGCPSWLLQRVLLWVLPVEAWREVLGFCPFEEYAHLVGLRRSATWTVQWRSQPASREFYHLLKLSLLEMRFHTMLPSASLGGRWLASRGPEGKLMSKMRLGGWLVLSCLLSVSLSWGLMGRMLAVHFCVEGVMYVTRGTIESLNEVVPLNFLRELHVTVPVRRPILSEEVKQALEPMVGNPEKCVVTVCRQGGR